MASTSFTEDLDDLKALVEQCGIKDAVLVNRAMRHVGK